MSENQQNLLIIRGHIAGLPVADQRGIALAAQKLREVIALHNDHGRLALALVGAELAAEE